MEGKRARLLDKPAMKAITDGCSTISDVDVKKSDFYYRLKYSYGITEDPHDNYYDEKCFSTNLESEEYDDEEKSKKKENAIKLISHINKLRNGGRYHNDIESEHIIVTNTKITLLISKEQTDRIKASEGLDSLCNFAVSLDRITNLLWYKLGNGFSKATYPSSLNALLKARIVLSSSIAKNADRVFSEAKKQYEAGQITTEQVVARIVTLRGKLNLPEDLNGDAIDEIMDFSPEYLNRYEEQFKNTQNSLKEKETVIETLKAESERKLSEKDATIALQSVALKSKDDENAKLRDELKVYEQKEAEAARKKEKRKNILKFAGSILWKIGILAVISILAMWLENKYNLKTFSHVIMVVDIVGFICTVVVAIKKDWNKYIKEHSNIAEV